MPKIKPREPIRSFDNAPDYITVDEFCFLLRCSASKAFRMLSDGRIKAVKCNGSTLIETASAKCLITPRAA